MTEKSLPLNQILHGDCVKLMEQLPEASIDLVFADPPYNLQLQKDLWRPNLTRVEAVTDEWDQFPSFEAYDAFTYRWLSACRRVLKSTGTIWVIGTYHNIYRVGAILQNLGYWILNDVVWIKSNPMPNFRGVRFTNAQESLIWAQKRRGARYTFNHQAVKGLNGDLQMRSDWYLPLCNSPERIKINGNKAHTTQKPEALLYRVLLSSTNPGDIVLDPFFGTGTTGAVAKKLGRQWIGIEREESYIDIARRRIQELQVPEAVSQAVSLYDRRKLPRVPFGSLVERGWLQPGQELYFNRRKDLSALVMADGKLCCDHMVGSIHQLGRHLMQAACNGWEHWYYLDLETQEMVVIDHLRQRARDDLAGSDG